MVAVAVYVDGLVSVLLGIPIARWEAKKEFGSFEPLPKSAESNDVDRISQL